MMVQSFLPAPLHMNEHEAMMNAENFLRVQDHYHVAIPVGPSLLLACVGGLFGTYRPKMAALAVRKRAEAQAKRAAAPPGSFPFKGKPAPPGAPQQPTAAQQSPEDVTARAGVRGGEIIFLTGAPDGGKIDFGGP
jgi:hypothetical protein